MRDMIFISHANPEDNEFTRWLALQLAREGYPVWCDLTKLLGGEDFWEEIEEAIRERTHKFIYVFSRVSNTKKGPKEELHLARNVSRQFDLKRFIIPVKIDDLKPEEFNINLGRITAIPFQKSWAEGLRRLIKRLNSDGVTKKENFGPRAVTTWWNSEKSGRVSVTSKHERVFTSWLPIIKVPDRIYFNPFVEEDQLSEEDAVPVVFHGGFLISFGTPQVVKRARPTLLFKRNAFCVDTEKFIAGDKLVKGIDGHQARNIVKRLLRVGWERMMLERKFCKYALSDKANAFAFTEEQVAEGEMLSFDVDGLKTKRAVIGYKLRRIGKEIVGKRYWHFGIRAKAMLYPVRGYKIKTHVLFSYDGKTFLESKSMMHTARRSQCKNWWNDTWRDRMLAMLNYLAGGNSTICVSYGGKAVVKVASTPIVLESPVSYQDPPPKRTLEWDVGYEDELPEENVEELGSDE